MAVRKAAGRPGGSLSSRDRDSGNRQVWEGIFVVAENNFQRFRARGPIVANSSSEKGIPPDRIAGRKWRLIRIFAGQGIAQLFNEGFVGRRRVAEEKVGGFLVDDAEAGTH